MKISSKSILTPGHHRDPPSSSSAVTRRLKPNRSLRGAQSPMFPSTKPRGARPFENPEPSSPKVTCIGQVRVKARKKQGINRNLQKNLSRRGDVSLLQDRNRGEVSFRRVDKNQRWVHFPLTICESLSCLFPCRTPSCLSNGEREKVERERGDGAPCGAVFARWLVAVEGEKREIELVVGGEEEEERESGFRRHGVGEIEMEQGRVSICVPPKNALLLMRCRSDPLRVNALANRLWKCPDPDEEDDDEERETGLKRKDLIFMGKFDAYEKLGFAEAEEEVELKSENEEEEEVRKCENSISGGEKEREDEIGDELKGFESESVETTESLEIWEHEELGSEKTEDLEIGEINKLPIAEAEELEIGEINEFMIAKTEELEFEKAMELLIEKTEDNLIVKTEELEVAKTGELVIEDLLVSGVKGEEFEERRNSRYSCSSAISLHLDIAERETEKETEKEKEEPELEEETEEDEEERETQEREREPVLPDCLLMMRYEPKLSMEVSKETWICSTDFIRWLPKRRPKTNKIDGRDEPKKRTTVDPDAPLPPRSSCSFPAPPPPASMAAMIEQRLMSAVAYEPFVLTRCKSEPMRTAAAKLIPETCFWKNRQFEPHRSANFGVGATGVGF